MRGLSFMRDYVLNILRKKKFAKSVYHQGQDKSWFLVGDAAMGMPFFRSVNSGVILGSQLAYLLAIDWMDERTKARVYNYYTRPARIAQEFSYIGLREMQVRFYKDLVRPACSHCRKQGWHHSSMLLWIGRGKPLLTAKQHDRGLTRAGGL